MSRIAIHATVALLAAAPLSAQIPQPIVAPIRPVQMRFNPVTGAFNRVPVTPGQGGLGTVYDNSCPSGLFLPLPTQGQIGGSESRAVGDWGAIPGDMYAGGAGCVPGCQSAYEISQFEISYCTLAAVQQTAVINFWDIPQTSCTLGPTVIGGVTPPAVVPVHSTVVGNLPGSALPGVMSCYQITIELGTPGFVLGGATNIVPGDVAGDRFAWSIQFPTTDGSTGPVLAGNPGVQPCSFCAGTIWELGNESPNPGTGFGQDDHLFVEDYGGPQTNDCFQLPTPWSGLHLELASPDVCLFATATTQSFCDGADGSLVACPCGNPGASNTGCDNAQGTGGVGLQVVDQNQTINKATLIGTGYPVMSQPAAIVIRSDMIDPNTPVVFGDGLRCVSTNALVRLAGTLASGGVSRHTFGHNSSMAGVGFFYYQIWYRNQPAGFCLAPPGTLAYNLSDGKRMYWIQ